MDTFNLHDTKYLISMQSSSHDVKVIIKKKINQPLGMSICQFFTNDQNEKDDGYRRNTLVTEVASGSLADAHNIKKGWLLSHINNKDISCFSLESIVSELKKDNKKVTLTFKGKKSLLEKEIRSHENSKGGDKLLEKDNLEKCANQDNPNSSSVNSGQDNGKDIKVTSKKPTRKRNNGMQDISQFFFPPQATSPEKDNAPKRAKTTTTLAEDKMIEELRLYGICEATSMEYIAKAGCNLNACLALNEEKKFQEDLRRAQIQSEESKQADKERFIELEAHKLNSTDNLDELFPESIILSGKVQENGLKCFTNLFLASSASQRMMRKQLIKLLKLEKQTIRWYGNATFCYFNNVSVRINDVISVSNVTNCSTYDYPPNCPVLQIISHEIAMLERHLFGIPDNEGGVPKAFLNEDMSQSFKLDVDGIELVEDNREDNREESESEEEFIE